MRIIFRALCWLQNRMLEHEVERLAVRRHTGQAVELRELIRRLETYADTIDRDITG